MAPPATTSTARRAMSFTRRPSSSVPRKTRTRKISAPIATSDPAIVASRPTSARPRIPTEPFSSVSGTGGIGSAATDTDSMTGRPASNEGLAAGADSESGRASDPGAGACSGEGADASPGELAAVSTAGPIGSSASTVKLKPPFRAWESAERIVH